MSGFDVRRSWKVALPLAALLGMASLLLLRRGADPAPRSGGDPRATKPRGSEARDLPQDPTPYAPQARALRERWEAARRGTPEAWSALEADLQPARLALLLLKEPAEALLLIEGLLSEPRHSYPVVTGALAAIEMHPGEPGVQTLWRLLDEKAAAPAHRPAILMTSGRIFEKLMEKASPELQGKAGQLHERMARDPDPQVRAAALASTFRLCPTADAEEKLLDLFTRFTADRDPTVVGALRNLVRSYGSAEYPRLRDAITSVLDRSGDGTQAAAALAMLVETFPSEARPRILGAFGDSRPEVKAAAVSLAAGSRLAEAVPALVDAWKTVPAGDRASFDAVLQALSRVGTPEAVEAMLARLREEPEAGRRALIATDLSAVEILRQHDALGRTLAQSYAREQDPAVRERLEKALAANGTPTAIEKLRQVFAGSSEPAHRAGVARLLLESEGGPDFAVREFPWLLGTPLADDAAERVAEGRPADFLPLVRAAYSPAKAKDLSLDARLAMIRGMASLAAPEARAELERILSFDGDEKVRAAIAKALEKSP
jgi:hypothetical protein